MEKKLIFEALEDEVATKEVDDEVVAKDDNVKDTVSELEVTDLQSDNYSEDTGVDVSGVEQQIFETNILTTNLTECLNKYNELTELINNAEQNLTDNVKELILNMVKKYAEMIGEIDECFKKILPEEIVGVIYKKDAE